MKISDFNYVLPENLIADKPPKVRGTSGLLVLDRRDQTIAKRRYFDMVEELVAGDVLVINQTKVIKARLHAKKESGVVRELVVVENHGNDDDWFTHKVIYRGKIKVGEKLSVGGYQLDVVEIIGDGLALVRSSANLLTVCDELGEPPLPPYMNRRATKSDIKRYQTVFAKDSGSVAAPTASLNMTEELLTKLRAKGIEVAYLTLHVGLGTFLPIRTDNLEDHKMHKEYFEIPQSTIARIYDAKRRNRRVVALGTTVTRTLEYANDEIMAMGQKLADDPEHTSRDKLIGEADIFIYPGYEFKVVDVMITNFHAPKSTVLMMASSFAGWDFLKSAYQYAIDEEMKFLSYGDSMLIK